MNEPARTRPKATALLVLAALALPPALYAAWVSGFPSLEP